MGERDSPRTWTSTVPEGHLGGSVGHQASVGALVFLGYGMDGNIAHVEEQACDGLGVIGENHEYEACG